MRKLLKRVAFVLLMLTIIDLLAGVVLDKLRDYSPDGRYFKTKYSLEESREEIIIMGSSRGETNIVPKIIEDSLGYNCWNTSRGGQGLPFFRAIQEGILARYTPKVVIFNIDHNLLETPPNYEHATVLRPFYRSCQPIRKVLNEASPFEWLLQQSSLFSYNSSFYYLIRPYFFPGLDGSISDKGWKPRLEKMNTELKPQLDIVNSKDTLNKESVALFEIMVHQFKKRGCQLFFVISPNYGRKISVSHEFNYLQEKAKKENIPLFIYSNDTHFITNAEYFVDPDHMNIVGAETFTRNLTQKIKPLLNQNVQQALLK